MNALHILKQSALLVLPMLAVSVLAANHTVEADSGGRMLNLRTVYPSVGDTVTLPAVADNCSYVIGNTNIAEMVSGNVMQILKPGATSIAYYTGSSVSTWNDCAEVTVPPDPKGSGSVYVWTRTANDGSGNWADSANWTRVRGPGSSFGYPASQDDVAMALVNGQRKWMLITMNADITVGALWTGSVRHQYNSGNFAARFKGTHTLTFSASDGSAELHIVGSATDELIHLHEFGRDASLPIVLASDLTVDFGYASGDRTCNTRDFLKLNKVDLTLPEAYTIRFQNIYPGNLGGASHTIEMTSDFSITGAGTVINDSAATVYKGGNWSAFTGTYIEQGCGHLGYHDNNSNANTYQPTVPNSLAKMVVRGFPQIATTSAGNTFRGYLTSWGNFAGFLRLAGSASSNPGNRLGYGEVDLEGGFIDIRCDAVSNWAAPVLVHAPGKLVAKEGFSGIMFHQQSTETHPTNLLLIADISNANGAMLSIREPMSDNLTNSTDAVRGWVAISNFASHAIGGSGDVAASAKDYKIIPWLVSPTENRADGDARFYGVDSENRIMVPVEYGSTATTLDSYTEYDNAVVNGGALSFDGDAKTLNSLRVRNMGPSGGGIPAGKRLTVTSGGVLLTFQGIIGTLGSSGDEAGELHFPNRGYVWDVGTDDNAWKHGQIWDKVIAPHGVSFAAVNHNGARIYLGGDQTGIEGDITINCGMLSLGADAYGSWSLSDTYKGTCKLRPGLVIRVVGATSKLEIPTLSSRSIGNIKVVLRDVGGHPAKISVPDADTTVKIRELVVENDDGEEILFPAGVYAAAAGEGVDFVDEHIVGDGKILIPPSTTLLIVR